MIKGRKVYDPLTDTWSTGYWVVDDKGNYYPVWQKGAVMERLTDSNKEIPTLDDNAKYWLKVYFKLKEYEDLEEQGRLVKLPCKVGDTVYLIKDSETITECKADMVFIGVLWEEFGKEWFPTRDEAEAKLKELRGRKNESSN